MALSSFVGGFQSILTKRLPLVSQPLQRACFCSQLKKTTTPMRQKQFFIIQQHVRGFRERTPARFGKRSLTPVEEIEGTVQKTFRDLLKPFGFTVLVSGCSFAGCSIWQYETLRTYIRQNVNKVQEEFTQRFYGKAGGFRHHMNAYWNRLSPGQKTVAGIIGLNTGVFLLWKANPLRRLMLTYFASSPMSAAPCWSMLLCNFSHYSLLHLAMNMYVLWSFAPAITGLLGREQFLAMFISAGMVSSLTSYAHKIARRSMVPSLGASGAIMAVIGAICSQYPDARLSIAFVGDIIPHSFSAGSAMKAIIVFDTLGVLLKWRFFDHAAHLGGILFGLWYVNYGHTVIWKRREAFLKWWHAFRGDVK